MGTPGELSDRVALVTGAGRGIGHAVAASLARAGAAVALLSRTEHEVVAAAREIEAAGGRAIGIRADVGREEEVAASVARVVDTLGPVDILVNNAGDWRTGRIDELPVAEWRHLVDVNLIAPYLYCRAVVPGMVSREWGRVVNVASANSKKGAPFLTGYCAAKHGVIGLTCALALEVAPSGVTVNAVCPGYTRTSLQSYAIKQKAGARGVTEAAIEQEYLRMIPQQQAMVPEDIAPAVLFLVSDGASHITGEAMNVSAGAVMH